MNESISDCCEALHAAIRRQTRTLLVWIVVANAALGAAVFAAAKVA